MMVTHMRNDPAVTIGVLLDTQFDHGMRVLQGVQDFASHQSAWQVLALHSTQEPLLGDLLRQRRLAGVIGPILSDRWIAGLPGSPVPVINVSGASNVRRVASVIPDERAVGRLAAQHFVDNGWRNLACLAQIGSTAASLRQQGFAESAAIAGLPVALPPPVDSYAPDAAWPAWLATLSRPCAVFCTSDHLARRLVSHVRALAWRIPQDVAIVGVGDSALDGVLAGVALSSVMLPGRRMGWRAAERLSACFSGAAPGDQVEFMAPERLAIRASSALTLGHGLLVARALGLMQQSMSTPLDVDTLARQCGVSRRTLELHFIREVGHGPATERRCRRVDLARRLLAESQLPLESVAEATGFATLQHFSVVFRSAVGVPPGAYRRAQAGSALTRA
jgi:LacI family transcriptional regulator